ncbi:MAG: hypothetical protein AAFY02_18850 [Pseudomonadota bacterium]
MSLPNLSGLNVIELTVCRFDQALPLARTALPDLTLPEWRRFLFSHLQQPGSGVLAVENPRGVLLACAAYTLRKDLRHGCYLAADPVIIMDLVGATAVAKALEQGLEAEAQKQGCGALLLQLPHHSEAKPDNRAVTAFLGCGLAAESLNLFKRVAGERPAA